MVGDIGLPRWLGWLVVIFAVIGMVAAVAGLGWGAVYLARHLRLVP